MPDPLSPKPTARIVDSPVTQSSVNVDTNNYLSGEGDPDEINVASFLAPAKGEGELGRLERYRILKELGRGGMGMVLMAEDSRLHRMAAIKIMLPKYAKDMAARERFLREARAAAKINHDNVVRIHQVDEANGIPFIAMEFLKGEPLDRYLKDKGELSIGQALRIGREIAEGLHAAHAEGLIHRDIKPANVWLEAPKGRVKILDFGLAREERDAAHLTQSGAVVGTPAYMSPEQAHGRPLDPRSDLFSLGVVLYRLCTGRQPFTGPNTMAVLMALGTETPAPVRQLNPNVPVALEQLIQRLLAKDRDQRPRSGVEVVEALAAIEKPANSGMPEVVYVPAATAVMDDPFANIDDPDYENPPTVQASPGRKSAQATGSLQKPASRRLLFAGLAGVFAIVAAFVIIELTNKDGPATESTVTESSKKEVTQNGKVGKKDPSIKVEPKKVVPPTFEEMEAKKHQEEWAAKLMVPVEATNKIGMKMILIPPLGKLTPQAYYLGKYEVTQPEWTQVMGYNPSLFSIEANKAKVIGMDTTVFPVESASWFDSVEFCNKLSAQEGMKPYYDLKVTKRGGKDSKQIEVADVKVLGGSGYRIPTDAEWDRGCRAGTKSAYHFGDKDEDLPDYAWFDKNSDGRTHAVGEKKPNAFGLHDMHGNVWEWNEEMLTNVGTGALERAFRGGSWLSAGEDCRAANRCSSDPSYRNNRLGFRLARVP